MYKSLVDLLDVGISNSTLLDRSNPSHLLNLIEESEKYIETFHRLGMKHKLEISHCVGCTCVILRIYIPASASERVQSEQWHPCEANGKSALISAALAHLD